MEPKNLSRITMFVVFIFLVVTCNMVEMTPILASILPKLHRCSRHHSNIGICIKRSIESMRPYIANGIPGLNTKYFEPYRIIHYEFNLGNKYKGNVMFKDISIHGLSNYTIKQTRVSIDAHQIEFIALFPFIQVHSYYEIQSPNLTLPTTNRYQIQSNFTDVKANILIDGEYYINDEIMEEYFRLKEVVILQLFAKKSNSYRDMPQILTTVAYTTLNNIWRAIDDDLRHIIRLSAADVIFNFASTIYDSFPTKMLFPF